MRPAQAMEELRIMAGAAFKGTGLVTSSAPQPSGWKVTPAMCAAWLEAFMQVSVSLVQATKEIALRRDRDALVARLVRELECADQGRCPCCHSWRTDDNRDFHKGCCPVGDLVAGVLE